MPDRHQDASRVLDDIDDVITDWQGSADAMRWRPPPAAPRLPSPEQLQAAVTSMATSLQPMVTAFQRLAEQYRTALPELARALRPALIAAQAAAEPAQACHCLCTRNHPGVAACLGEVPEQEVRSVRYGAVMVPMCAPCADRAG